MNYRSIFDNDFISEAKRILADNGELLILIQYPYSAGNRDFFIINSPDKLDSLISERKPSDCVTVMRSFITLKHGVVDHSFIKDSLDSLTEPTNGDWLIIGEDNFEHTANWAFAENIDELKEELNGRIGNEVYILEEPDWNNDEMSITAYAPCSDGIVRPAAY